MLLEVKYEDILSPKTMASLKGKSGQSLKQMLGDKNLMQTLRTSQKLFNDIIKAEKEYHDELEMVAIQMVKDAYPVIEYANIEIEAKIVGRGDINTPLGDGNNETEDPSSPDFGDDDPEKIKAKRRIINGITQGASIRGAFGFMLFREYLDEINPELVSNYNEILKLVFGIYDDENAIAMMLVQLAQGQKMGGGKSDMEYNEENNKFIIKAKALCFPMLVHEIIKGLYEIMGTQGFIQHSSEKAQAAVSSEDTLSSEPHDFQYGKFIYDALNKLYVESDVDDSRVRELFFVEVYKLDEDEFIPFIENAVNDELDRDQKKWALDTIKDIARDLSKDDTGLEDLDEITINKPSKHYLIAELYDIDEMDIEFFYKVYYGNNKEKPEYGSSDDYKSDIYFDDPSPEFVSYLEKKNIPFKNNSRVPSEYFKFINPNNLEITLDDD